MANTLLLKRSSTGGAEPSAGSLSAGELALNTTDMRLFSKSAGGSVFELAGNAVQAITRASFVLTGGGTISLTAGMGISWTARFIVMNAGRGSHFSTGGHYNITMPADSTVIPGYAGAADVTVASGAIVLASWTALYYELPINAAQTSIDANFKIVGYTSNFVVPDNWIMLAIRSGDGGYIKFGTGVVLRASESYDSQTYSTRRVPRADLFTTARTINGVSFDGSANITVADSTKLPTSGGTITGNLAVDGSTTLGDGPARLFVANTGTTPGRNYFVGRNLADDAWAFSDEFGWDQSLQRWYFDQTPYVGSTQMWHAGNDGAASGLDADLLDGLHASSFQPVDTNLTAISALTPAADRLPYYTSASAAALATFTAFGRSLVDDADAAAGRTTLGLGTIATQAASSVAITGGTAYGLTNLAVGHSASVSAEAAGVSVTPTLLVAGSGGNSSAMLAARYGANSSPAAVILAKSRNNTVGSHTVVAAGDIVGTLSWSASDGSSFTECACILGSAEGTISSGIAPGKLSLQVTQAGASAPSEVLSFNSSAGCYFPLVGTTASAANAFLNNASSPANQLLRSTSSLRYKEDVTDLTTEMSSRVLKLRPVRYRSKAEADRKDWTFYGFIAEEVAEIEPRLVHYIREELEPITVERQTGTTEDGTPIITTEVVPQYSDKLLPDGVMYDRVVVLLLHCVQGLSARLEALEAKLS